MHDDPSPLEGGAERKLRESKANLIRSLMGKESLSADEACLVEDDPAEIQSVQGICRSVFVAERRGIMQGEMEVLLQMAGAKALVPPPEGSAKKAPQPSAPGKAPEGSTVPAAPNVAVAKPDSPPPPGKAVGAVGAVAAPPPPAPSKAGVSAGVSAGDSAGEASPASPAPPKAPKVEAVPPATPETPKEARSVKHIYFDFDQTLSRIHVFKQLAGWEPGVSPPHASSERGQIHRLQMLSDAGQVYAYDSGGCVIQAERALGAAAASWTACALGGWRRGGSQGLRLARLM